MDFKKIFTTKTGLAAVIVIITILSILGYSIVCKRGGSYMFKDSRGEVKENFQNGEKFFDLSDEKEDVIDDENDMSHYVISDDISYDSIYTDKNILDSNMNIRTVRDQVFLGDGYYGFLSVDDGKLNMFINRYLFKNEITYRDTNFETVYLSHSFDGEKVKYIYYDYFQPSGDVVIWALTDTGNVYLNNFKRFYSGDIFNTYFFDSFEKKFTNVVDLRIVENVYNNEMCPNSCTLKDLALVGNGKPIEISRWGN